MKRINWISLTSSRRLFSSDISHPTSTANSSISSESAAAKAAFEEAEAKRQKIKDLGAKGIHVIKKFKDKRPIVLAQRARNAELERKAAESRLPWRIVAATVFHRPPQITKDPEPWFKEMSDLQEKIEAKRLEHYKNKVKGTPSDIIDTKRYTVEELASAMPFKVAPRISEDDINDNRRSNYRKFQDSLFLVVKRNRNDHQWQFPQGKWLPEETMSQTADRVLGRAISNVSRQITSNAPIGHYLYQYPKELQEKRGNFGAKVFFYHCFCADAPVILNEKLYTDYNWITRSDVPQYFDPDTAHYLDHLLPY